MTENDTVEDSKVTEENLELAKRQDASLAKQEQNKMFEDMTSGADYFARVQLMQGQSTLVQEKGLVPGTNVFIKTKEDFTDLDKQFDCLVIAMRLKAMRIDGDEVLAVFDIQNPEFNKIREEAKTPGLGSLAGPEFLLYVPSVKSFATLFMASPTAKRVAPKVRSYIDEETGVPGAITIGSVLITGKKYKWFGPTVQECSTPFDTPNEESFIEAMHKFQNPPVVDLETAPEESDSDRAR